jgi:hypothetical protein
VERTEARPHARAATRAAFNAGQTGRFVDELRELVTRARRPHREPARRARSVVDACMSVTPLTRTVEPLSPITAVRARRLRNHARFALWLARCNFAAHERERSQ